MKKLYSIILAGIAISLAILFVSNNVFGAAVERTFWEVGTTDAYTRTKLNTSAVRRNVGATGDRIPNGFFTNLDTTTLVLGGAITGDVHVNDDSYATFGNTFALPDASLGWNTAQTVDALFMGLSAAQNTLVLAERADAAFDFAHAAQTNPTLFGHSATQSTTEWWGITHNQTNTIISSGVGQILFQPAGNIAGISASSAGNTLSLASTNSDNTNLASIAEVSISTGGAASGDPQVQFNISGVGASTVTMGIDNSDSDAWVLSIGTALGAANTNAIHLTPGVASALTFQNRTFTAGAAHNAVTISPIWAAENFVHRALAISPTQNGANTQTMTGITFTMTKATAATTLENMYATAFLTPVVTGTVTSSNVMFIQDQTNANITTPRGINFATAGVANSIVWGGSALQYANAVENIRFMDSTNARGIAFDLTVGGNQTISATAGGLTLNNNRVGIGIAAGTNSDLLIGASANDVAGYRMSVGYTDTSTTGTIRALNSEMTANPGGASDASYQSVSINTYTSVGLAQNLTGSLVGGAYFVENRLNAANTLTLAAGSSAGFTNTTGITTTAHGYRSIIVVTAGTVTNGAGFFVRPPTNAGTLVNMIGLDVSDVSLAGGTTAYGVRIQSQTANATTTRAIEIVGTGVNNGIQLGDTGVLISNDGDGAITFLGSSAGADEDFTINLDDTANTIALSSSTGVTDVRWDTGTGVGQFTLDGSTGGCIMLRDTDDAGWTEVDALDGVLTASIDADGICD